MTAKHSPPLLRAGAVVALLAAAAGSAAAAPATAASTPALPVGSTPPLIQSEQVFRPRSDDTITLVARAAALATPALGADVDIELRTYESFGIGGGYLADDGLAAPYLRLMPFGLAINHYTVTGFVDIFFDDETEVRTGGSLSLPLYRMADIPADLSLYAGVAYRFDADVTDVALGLEYALW